MGGGQPGPFQHHTVSLPVKPATATHHTPAVSAVVSRRPVYYEPHERHGRHGRHKRPGRCGRHALLAHSDDAGAGLIYRPPGGPNLRHGAGGSGEPGRPSGVHERPLG